MSLQKANNQEPALFLFKVLWRFTPGLHGWIALYILLFIVANAILLTPALIFGSIVSQIQSHGLTPENFPYLSFLLSLFLVEILTFWLLHGPARVIERWVAFWAEV